MVVDMARGEGVVSPPLWIPPPPFLKRVMELLFMESPPKDKRHHSVVMLNYEKTRIQSFFSLKNSLTRFDLLCPKFEIKIRRIILL